jgi:hypothetical protein
MPIITSPWVEIVLAFATIVFGILVEKWYVSKYSIAFNAVNTIILAFTLDASQIITIILLIVYAVIGAYSIRSKGHNTVKQLFGSKCYGSLSLALASDQLNRSFLTRSILAFLEQFIPSLQILEQNIVVFSWMMIAVVVFVIQGIVLLKSKRSH